MPALSHPCINYISLDGDGDRGIVSCASTILLTGIQGRKTMTNNRLWQEVVDDYYNEANYYLVVEA